MNRKKQNPVSWPFSLHRQTWIEKADKFLSVAADAAGEATASGEDSPLGFRKYRKAARYYERAAEYYRKAGLGVMSQGSWQDAAECWSIVGEQDECLRCERSADSIDTYYEDESEDAS